MEPLASREHLIEQAALLFRAKGYTATSIDDISRACGVTKGSVYYHFANKEALAVAAMERVHAYFTDHVFSILTGVERPGVAEFERFNAAVEAFFDAHPDGCLLANLSLDAGAESVAFKAKIQAYFAAWRDCYEKVYSGCFAPAPAKTLAEDAVAIIQGCLLMRRIDGESGILRRQHRRLVDLISRLD